MGSYSIDSSESLESRYRLSSVEEPEEDRGGFTISSSRAPVKVDTVATAKVAASLIKRYSM